MSGIRIFSNGSQYGDWVASNCERCTKCGDPGEPGSSSCDIFEAICDADLDDGTVSDEIASRCGLTDNRLSYVWMCPEVEWTEAWKAEYIRRYGAPKETSP